MAGSKLAHKREDRQAKASSHSSGGTGKVSHGSSGVSSKESRKMELRKEDDKVRFQFKCDQLTVVFIIS